MTKNITFIILFLLAFKAFAQTNINDYKYVIVPNKYEFLKTEDEHRLNWLTKSLFQDLNFEAIMNNDPLPEELKNNTCLALKADVLDDSKMFKTKLKIQLINCDGEIVYTSENGISKEKNYKKAYHEALRMAFKFLKAKNYSYKPNEKILAKETVLANQEVEEIKKLKQEIKELKEEKAVLVTSEVKPIEKKEKIVTKIEKIDEREELNPEINNNTLTAQLIPGSIFSYDVKNAKGELVYTLLFSGKEDYYMVKGVDALVYKVNNNWVIAQYYGNELKVKSVDLKF